MATAVPEVVITAAARPDAAFELELLPLLGHPGAPARDCHGCRPLARRNGSATFLTLTDNECKAPWAGSARPKNIFHITDQKPGRYGVLAPFVLARPAWLVGAAGAGAAGAGGGAPWQPAYTY